jgi:diguanylate cyclase (GGDEF)-like protein
MVTLTQTAPIADNAEFPLQAPLLQRIIGCVLIGVAIAAIPLMLTGNWFPSAILLLSEVAMLLALLALKRNNPRLAGWLILSTLTVCVAILLVAGKGPLDESVLAVPGLMIFASLFCSRRIYLSLLLFVATLLVGVGVLHFMGWRVIPVARVRPDTFISVIVILSITSYFVWLMASTLRGAMASLETENRRARKSLAQIEKLANHDALTGLPNRLLARDRFEQAASHAQRSQSKAALMFLDLDNFKTVNDSLGHAAGDALLCDVAARLLASVRANDTVSRQGGDEFLIVLGDLADEDAVAAIAVKLVEQLATPFVISGLEITATCSLGIALFPDNGKDFDNLLKHADMAMYQAKDSGRNAFHFFDEGMHSNVAEHLQLISAMRTALVNGEFRLNYQPLFALKDQRIVGCEALLRWHHPVLGDIPPAKFIPLAERSGLIVDIGAWVLHEACRQARAWQLAGLTDLTMAINVSPAQFQRDAIEHQVTSALAAADLSAGCIELELTESLLIKDSSALRELLGRLRALGLRFSIDDFGTGYSNLGYLKRFDVEKLKIDQSFVKRMTSDADDEGIVRAIVQMSHSLRLQAVAEGIEDAQALASLVEMGCDYGQGFHWSPALPANAFFDFVRSHGGYADLKTNSRA